MEKFQSVAVREGEAVTLRAKATGNPQPTFQWLKDNVPIAPGNAAYQITAQGGETTLAIPKARYEDSGWYTCNASNQGGTFSLRGRVTVQPKSGPHAHYQQQQQVNLPQRINEQP